jgi:hypothetical protein
VKTRECRLKFDYRALGAADNGTGEDCESIAESIRENVGVVAADAYREGAGI